MIDIIKPETKGQNADDNPLLLMCKDKPVFNVTQNIILDENLLPGCMLRGTMNYSQWMKTRYSAGSNVSARRLMLRAFGSDIHNEKINNITRTLSLSDCYWLKQQNEEILFNDVTPYLHKEWDGTGAFKGGSISTLFVNGAADKRWLNSGMLLKVNSFKEFEPYMLCSALGLDYTAKVTLSGEGILVTNFTSTDYFLETMEQSGFITENINPMEKAVEFFQERAATLFVIDYLVEHDDRHWGNYGFLRNANTGEYVSMAPYFDFDWAWSGGVTPLPNNAIQNYSKLIYNLCSQALKIDCSFEHKAVIVKRADKLLKSLLQT